MKRLEKLKEVIAALKGWRRFRFIEGEIRGIEDKFKRNCIS
jgi:hypothetical protein